MNEPITFNLSMPPYSNPYARQGAELPFNWTLAREANQSIANRDWNRSWGEGFGRGEGDLWANGVGDQESRSPYASPDLFHVVLSYLNLFLIPLVVVVGVVANLLSVAVFCCTHLWRQSSSVYLAGLALADTGFLTTLFIGWFGWLRIHLVHQPGWCQIVVYVAYVSSFLSVWIVVAFTVERYIAVCHPFKRNAMCTCRRAKLVIGGLTLFAALTYSFSLWTSHTVESRSGRVCLPNPRFMTLINAMMNFDTVITLILPSLLIVTLNIRIASKMYVVLRERGGPLEEDSGRNSASSWRGGSARSPRGSQGSGGSAVTRCPSHGRPILFGSRHQRHLQSQINTTRMLLLVSTVFILLNFPTHALRIYAFIRMLSHRDQEYRLPPTAAKCLDVFQLLYYLHFSINFFLYSVCAKRFRLALKKLASRWKSACFGCVANSRNHATGAVGECACACACTLQSRNETRARANQERAMSRRHMHDQLRHYGDARADLPPRTSQPSSRVKCCSKLKCLTFCAQKPKEDPNISRRPVIRDLVSTSGY